MTAVAPWQVRERPTSWLAWAEPGRPGQLADVLETALRGRTERVMLTGARPVPGWLFGPQPPGWTASGHYLDAELPVARFIHDATGHRVQLRRAAEWFGPLQLTPAQAWDAWALLGDHYRRAFGDGRLFDSPGATGIDGWLRSGGSRHAQLDPDTAELVRATSPQHRVELFAHDGIAPGFVYVDGRWQYAALTAELGAAPAHRLTGAAAQLLAETRPYTRARYHVQVTVPAGWDHAGVLMAMAGDNPGDGWEAPREPGRVFQTWADAAETTLAARLGWPLRYLEGIRYTGGRRPLDTWTSRLVQLRERLLAPLGAEPDWPRAAAANAVRAILLHGIGSFHSTGRDLVRVVDPMTYTGDAPLEPHGDVWTVRERQSIGGRYAQLHHPEYSSQVWGRGHARLLESPTGEHTWAGIMQLPFRDVIGVRGDALYLTHDPGWPDDGRPGRLRVKGSIPGPIPYPTNMAQLNALRARAERTADA